MTPDITPENEAYIQQAIRDGRYSNEGQAVNEAVVLLRQRDQLRADVLAGIEQADNGELIPEEAVFAQLETRAQEIEDAARKEP